MSELAPGFQSLPPEYQHVIRLAQDTYNITVAPLQLLVRGWSGAVVYLVSVSWNESRHVEHCILKLDRKGKLAKSDEVTRHNTVMDKSTPEFARAHIAELVFDRLEVAANQEVIRSALSEAELAAAEKKGQAMTLDEALAFASEQQ
jgi:hypothetical protein